MDFVYVKDVARCNLLAMASAVADPDPVLYYEHIALYRDPRIKQAMTDTPPAPLPLPGARDVARCTADDLPRAIAMRELAQAMGPLVVMTADPAGAIEAGADDAGGNPDEVAGRVAARLRAPRAARPGAGRCRSP